jgi:DNA-binding transcriptional LysR family regulator
MVAQLAARGLGVAILPSSVVSDPVAELHVLQIRPQLRSRRELAWDPTAATDPAPAALIEHARASMARAAGGAERAA